MKTSLAVLAVVALFGCGSESTEEPGGGVATEGAPSSGEVTTTYPVTVLDDGDGAELCLSGVATSLPPQCGGPRLVGWDWADHAGDHEDVSGVRWGSFVVTGTWDGTALTPAAVVPFSAWDESSVPPRPERDLTTPCPEPAGGWRPVEPATTTDRARNQAGRVARALPTYGELWVDQSVNPAFDQPLGPEDEMLMNDPAQLVLNVRVTDDLAGAEAAIREVWGGALCVSQARFTDRELARVQRVVDDLPGVTYSSRGDDRVDLGVVHDDGTLQARLDDEYGEGAVVVDSALRPVG